MLPTRRDSPSVQLLVIHCSPFASVSEQAWARPDWDRKETATIVSCKQKADIAYSSCKK